MLHFVDLNLLFSFCGFFLFFCFFLLFGSHRLCCERLASMHDRDLRCGERDNLTQVQKKYTRINQFNFEIWVLIVLEVKQMNCITWTELEILAKSMRFGRQLVFPISSHFHCFFLSLNRRMSKAVSNWCQFIVSFGSFFLRFRFIESINAIESQSHRTSFNEPKNEDDDKENVENSWVSVGMTSFKLINHNFSQNLFHCRDLS